MEFLEFYSHRPIPDKGFMVMNGRVRIRIPKDESLDHVLHLMNLLAPYTLDSEWVIACRWSHCYYLTIKEHRANQSAAKEFCRKSGFYSVIDCATKQQQLFKKD
jgi:hypothetical protein